MTRRMWRWSRLVRGMRLRWRCSQKRKGYWRRSSIEGMGVAIANLDDTLPLCSKNQISRTRNLLRVCGRIWAADHAIAFLPLGAGLNSAVYHVARDDGTPYFIKLRTR